VIFIHRKDGTTLKFDLSGEKVDGDEIRGDAELQELLADSKWTADISGMAVKSNKEMKALTLPKGFLNVSFSAESLHDSRKSPPAFLGERVHIQADEIRMTLTAFTTRQPRMTRIDIRKTGKPRFLPKVRKT